MLKSTDTVELATWLLVGKLGDAGALQKIPVAPLPFQIGRKPGISLCLPVPQVSKLHAEFYERAGILWVRDLDSTNGTYVNGKRVDRESRLQDGDTVQFASQVFRVQLDRQASMPGTIVIDHCDRAILLLQLDRMLVDREVLPHFQPIVSLVDGCVFGYEVLGRTRLFGLEMPKAIFETAAMFDLEQDVSQLFRTTGVRLGTRLLGIPNLFLNTHPTELLSTPELVESMRDLRNLYPEMPLTLEIHEAAVTSLKDIAELRTRLTELNVGLAYDDFGAGQSRLLELTEVPPDFIKFDMGLIRGIDQATASRQGMLESLVRMVQSLGIAALAEGIETLGEADACRQLGFEFAQGFHFGRPQQVDRFTDPVPAADDFQTGPLG